MTKSLKILYLSSYPPRKCGIATFTKSLIENISKLDSRRRVFQKVIAINERKDIKRDYPPEVCCILEQEELSSYEKVAQYINKSGADFLFLQHEFGLFGGFDGVFLLELLKKIKVPVLSFFHTIPLLKSSKAREWRLKILKEITSKSKGIISPSKRGIKFLKEKFNLSSKKVFHVWHGTPSVSFANKKERAELKRKYNLQKRFIIVTYGLLARYKGIDWALESIAMLKRKYPQILYVILGEPHFLFSKQFFKDFSKDIRNKIKKLSLERFVKLNLSYLKEEEIINYLKLSDIFLAPYLTPEQISSGTLSLALSCGCCCIATPFVYAKEVLQKNRGFFVPFKDREALKKVISYIIENPKEAEKRRKKAYDFARNLHWERVIKKILRIIDKVLKE